MPAQEAGRSRGGLTSKLHMVADRRCRPIAHVLTAGHRHDSLAFEPVLAAVCIPRGGGGRPRTRPDRVLADKAYSSKAIRAYCAAAASAPPFREPADRQAHRAQRGRRGGRPLAFDPQHYRQRNVVERCINKLKSSGPWPPATTARLRLHRHHQRRLDQNLAQRPST